MPKAPSIAFLDFEASSLGKNGFPIEIAWVFVTGEEESHLIRPDPSWTEWDAEAEKIHRISKEQLQAQGMELDEVASRMIAALTDHALYATAPSWDGKWLSKLLRTAGLPRHALRLEDTEVAHRRVMQEILQSACIAEDLHQDIMHDILARAQRSDVEQGPAVHRALADARREQRLWLDIRHRAKDAAARLRKGDEQRLG